MKIINFIKAHYFVNPHLFGYRTHKGTLEEYWEDILQTIPLIESANKIHLDKEASFWINVYADAIKEYLLHT